MSEVKFACPVCGQHITTDASTSGSQLECPTCFRQLIVPQGATAGQTRLVLSALQASEVQTAPGVAWARGKRKRRHPVWDSVLYVLPVLLLAGAAREHRTSRHESSPLLTTFAQVRENASTLIQAEIVAA